MQPPANFPRVSIPGIDPEEEALGRALAARSKALSAAVEETVHFTRSRMVTAMKALGYRPYLGHVYRAPKPTKNVLHMARMKARASAARGTV